MKRVAITTIDNPFDPIREWDKWYQFDIEKGYGTLDYMARLVPYNDSLSLEEFIGNTENAIDIIVKNDPLGIYVKKVYEVNEDEE